MSQVPTSPFCLVIGAGSGGMTVAIGLAKAGKSVVLVERDKIGGDCTNSGCVPSKSLIHAAKTLPPAKAFGYVQEIIASVLEEESPSVLQKEYGIHVVFGDARMSGNTSVVVETAGRVKTFTPKHIVIATGSKPRKLEIKGLPKSKYHTNETIFNLKKPPKKLAIIGAGPIGIELAQAFARLGTKVSVLYRKYGILSNEDEAASAVITRALEADGVQFCWWAENIVYTSKGLEYSDASGTYELGSVDGVLVAIGRTPNLDSLGLDSTDIEFARTGIAVDAKMRTSVSTVYAIGDCVQGPNFTHVANAQGRSVIMSLLAPFLPQKSAVSVLPAVTFTDPEVATTGDSLEKIASYNQKLIDRIQVPLALTDRAKTDSLKSGHVTIWVTKVTGKVLRATIVGPHAGEMISFLTLLLEKRISLWSVTRMIVPYPVLFAAVKKAADEFATQTIAQWRSELSNFLKEKTHTFVSKHGLKVVGVLFWLSLVAVLRWYMAIHQITFIEVAQQLSDFLSQNRFGPLLYLVLYALRPLVFFPATLLTVMAGYMFGLEAGYVYAMVGAVITTVPFFMLGRWSKVGGATQSGSLAAYTRTVSTKPFQTTLLMRLLALPYDVVNFVCGRYGADLPSFLLATFVGNIVGSFAFVSLGTSITGDLTSGDLSVDPKYFALSIGVLLLSILITRVAKRVQSK